MMGPKQTDQAALFYEFSLERHVPAAHMLRNIDRFVDLSIIRSELAPFYSSTGRPSIDLELEQPDIAFCERVLAEVTKLRGSILVVPLNSIAQSGFIVDQRSI